MERYGSLSAVLNAPVEDLQKVEGIGESAAVLVTLVAKLSPEGPPGGCRPGDGHHLRRAGGRVSDGAVRR